VSESAAPPGRDLWSSNLVFVLAATGSAVGLGNIWKFPYITGENGGGAFVLVYLVCISLIGIPLMMAEVLIGRRGGQSPTQSYRRLAEASGASPWWRLIGWSGMIAAFLILTFYSVIGGWALDYLIKASGNAFEHQTAEDIGNLFSDLLSAPDKLLFWHTLFMALVTFVVARGVKQGIEKAVTLLIPIMFVLLVILLAYASTTDAFMDGVDFLFTPNFDSLTTESVLTALGHAFFTLSLGMSVMVAYGSFLPPHISITKAAITVSILDTVVALMAGMVIFPIVFGNGLEPGSGPGLIFQTLPLAFAQLPGGQILGTMFFFLLVFAAWSSAISLLEPIVERLEEKRFFNRQTAALFCGICAWAIGLLSVYSMNKLADFHPLDHIHMFQGKTIFDILDLFTGNFMLPVTGFMVALFCGWVVTKEMLQEELALGNIAFKIWLFLVRFVAPAGIIIIFIDSLLK